MQCISIKRALPAFIACALSSAAADGVAFTNHAGHAVSGRLSAITNGFAVVEGRRYPLSIFPAAEQARMRELLALPEPLPPALVALRRSLKERAMRTEALVAAGACGEAEAESKRARLQSIWARALEDESSLSAATRRHWQVRLMDP